MCSPEEQKSSKGNQNLCAWITIGATFLFILCMALIVFLKVGITENQESDNSEPANIQIQGAGIAIPVKVAIPKPKRKRTCKADTCGVGANCSEGKCACPPKYVGDPTTRCEKLECVENDDCPSNQACYNQKCVHPCENACAGQNAKCDVINHIPVCFCPAGYTGNAAFEDCKVAEPEPENDSQTEPGMTEASVNTEKASENGPGEVRDVCNPSPCGKNATCSIFQGQALCSYEYIPPAEFRTTTSKPQHECESDDECRAHFACRDYKCVSPCSDCGENAICKKLDHRAVCKCRRGYIGDPYEKCNPECEKDDDCPSTKPTCVDDSCVDPCYGACGINARCRHHGKSTICSCPRSTTGDPLVFCRRTDESVDNFCDPNPCGANATCTLSSDYFADNADYNSDNSTDADADADADAEEDYPVCICPSGYDGNPRTSCERSECDEDWECFDDSLACIDNQCVDPCFDDDGDSVCGEGAVCESRRHLAICTCLKGKYGDPFTRCYGGGGGGGGGGGIGGGRLGSGIIASLLG